MAPSETDHAGPRHSGDPHRPVSIHLRREQQTLEITWADGRTTVLSAVVLRRNCPCATCRGGHGSLTTPPPAGARSLPVLGSDPARIRMAEARLVGRYALRLFWTDGHDTGIYDFPLLRRLADEQNASAT